MIKTVPAEWAPHKAMWVGFPSHAELWEDDLAKAQAEVAALVRVLAESGETVRLFVRGEAAEDAAGRLLGGVGPVQIVKGRFGDIWLRDTGPIFLKANGEDAAAGFEFNGWGGKYDLEGDGEVDAQLAGYAGVTLTANPFILEGGALDHDGEGTILTTRQCLLNPNRNQGWTEGEAERLLAGALGAKKVIWLGEGLLNDHTDGHVDNLARFVAPGVVACPIAYGEDDPNAGVYDACARALAASTDAAGRSLRVVRIPSPGRVEEDGEIIPASHMNFLIGNNAVVVPTYGTPSADFAVEAVAALFPDRKVVGLPSNAILTGGGSFHCISQQEPV
jgi:agmatine deiminase